MDDTALTDHSLLFCPQCNNFLISKETDKGILVQTCYDCGIELPADISKPLRIYTETRDTGREFKINTRVIPDLAQDITMPRIRMHCKNPKCKNEVLIFKRGIKNMSRMIICPECGGVWIEEA